MCVIESLLLIDQVAALLQGSSCHDHGHHFRQETEFYLLQNRSMSLIITDVASLAKTI